MHAAIVGSVNMHAPRSARAHTHTVRGSVRHDLRARRSRAHMRRITGAPLTTPERLGGGLQRWQSLLVPRRQRARFFGASAPLRARAQIYTHNTRYTQHTRNTHPHRDTHTQTHQTTQPTHTHTHTHARTHGHTHTHSHSLSHTHAEHMRHPPKHTHTHTHTHRDTRNTTHTRAHTQHAHTHTTHAHTYIQQTPWHKHTCTHRDMRHTRPLIQTNHRTQHCVANLADSARCPSRSLQCARLRSCACLSVRACACTRCGGAESEGWCLKTPDWFDDSRWISRRSRRACGPGA
jgi:hypothetical protein